MASIFKFLRKRKAAGALWFMLDKLRKGTNAGGAGSLWLVQLQSVVIEIFGAGSPEVLFISGERYDEGRIPVYEEFIKNCIETIMKAW